jgi:predicted O-methyltransferase YrrM
MPGSRLGGVKRGARWLQGEIRDRQFVRSGGRFARSVTALSGGKLSSPGDLERYFDTHSDGPGIWKWRHYFPMYERHLAKFRDRPVQLAEVGVYSGGSLPMWRDWLGPKSHITGIDIEPACKAYTGERIEVVIGDQGDPGFWRSFLETRTVDVLIDDGSHRPEDQIETLRAVLPALSPGGVYVCEDVHRPSNPYTRFIEGFTRELDAFAPDADGSRTTGFQRAVASVHRYPYAVVIERTEAALERLDAPKRGTAWEPFLD